MDELAVVEAHVYLAAETQDNLLTIDQEDLIVIDLGTSNVINDDDKDDDD
jgi:hypothetical protein